jgi:PAS domain S-box-containing protein
MGVSEPLIQSSLLGEAAEHAPFAMFVADDEGRYVAVNRAACVLLGYTRGELLALTIADVARYADAQTEFEEMRANGTRVGISELTRKDGTLVRLEYVAGQTAVAGMQVYVAVGAAAN